MQDLEEPPTASGRTGSMPLSGIRVVELANPMNQLCGKVLADFGADVILIEEPTGCAARRIGPFKRGISGPENSLYFTYFNANKKGMTLDLAQPPDVATLSRLLARCDVFIESTMPGTLKDLGLSYETLGHLNPKIIMASITGFGQTGPFRDFRCPDIVAYAMGGQMWLNGKQPLEPAYPPVEIVNPMVSLLTAFAILSGIHWRDKSGYGQHIDASMYEALAGCMFQLTNYSTLSTFLQRQGKRNRHPASNSAPFGTYPTKDGRYVHISGARPWSDFFDWIGRPSELADSNWEDPSYRARNCETVDDVVEKFTSKYTLTELTAPGAMRHHTVAPVASPKEFIEDPQTRFRNYVRELAHPSLGRHPYLRPPFITDPPMWKIDRGAPQLGEHNGETDSFQTSYDQSKVPLGALEPAISDALPLEGLRILDFSQAIAGPLGLQWMAQFGAEILKVESAHSTAWTRPRDGMSVERRAQVMATHGEHFMGKRSLQVNMKTEDGRALVRELVKQCDVVVANFTPGVLEAWGMDYDSLRRINPSIIVAMLSGYGQSGPRSLQTSIGPHCMAACGLDYLWHYPGDDDPEPVCSVIWASDYIATGYLVSSIIAAVRSRLRTGQGQRIDVSQIETNAAIMGHVYLDVLLNGDENGSHSESESDHSKYPRSAPHAAYRCKGNDQWCVIAVTSEDEWRSLCLAMDHVDWVEDRRFENPDARRWHFKELRELIESWTVQRTPYQVMRTLQQKGVPAGVVQTGEDLYRCTHLRERHFVHTLMLPDIGEVEVPGCRVKLSLTPGRMGQYMELGEANSYVFQEILGLSSKSIEALRARGVFE